jgi:Zn-dependent protease with chaperone function
MVLIGMNIPRYIHLLKMMILYGIENVNVSIRAKFQNVVTFTLFKNYLIIGKPILESLDEAEMEGVISHEFSHIYNRDSLSALLISILFTAPFIFFWVTTDPKNISITSAFLIILSLFFWIYGFKVRNWVILENEIAADREAVFKTKNSGALQNALIKMTLRSVYSNKRPGVISTIVECSLLVLSYFFGFTHPHLKERIEYLDFANRLITKT